MTHYETQRAALIPRAESHAREIAGPEPAWGLARAEWAAKWNAAFHGEMERLWRNRCPGCGRQLAARGAA